MNTPEFLVWAIEYTCPVCGFQNGSDPEQTERQLRAARAVSEARREGRIFEGLCVQPPDGFRVEEGLAIYGGLGAVERACGHCPANALQRADPQSLAGCYGVVPLPDNETWMHSALERAIDRDELTAEVERHFPRTKPRWYGLWMQSPLEREQAAIIDRLLDAIELDENDCNRAIVEFRSGLQTVQATGMRMHHALYPRGVVDGAQWRLAPHCPQCHAPWNSTRRRDCNVCGYVGYPAPDKKRLARGKRPYFPLDRLLGAEQAQALLLRYAEFQGQRASRGQEEDRLLLEPPDNPQGG